jgi:serine/threonine-protein kinase
LKKLGKYELLGELGHGAMGVVYRARDPIINRLVALKTITIGVADDPALLQRFYREAQSAGGLQHPNIVTIYDMGEAGNLPYIAMELVEGENLEQVIARRPNLPITLKLVYAMQALLLAGPTGNNLIHLILESCAKAFEVAQSARCNKSVMVFGSKPRQTNQNKSTRGLRKRLTLHI